jgi:hypothetical protein
MKRASDGGWSCFGNHQPSVYVPGASFENVSVSLSPSSQNMFVGM